MKILYVTHEDPGAIEGGLGTFNREFLVRLKTRAEVKVLLLNFGQSGYRSSSPLVDLVVETGYAFPAKSYEGRVLATGLATARRIRQQLAGWEPDIIHCNDRQTYLPFAGDDRVVFSLHLSYPDLLGPQHWDEDMIVEKRIENLALQQAAATIVYSRFMAGRVLAGFSGVGNLVCLPLGVVQPTPLMPRPQVVTDRPLVVAFWGRLENRQKGLDLFMDALRRLAEQPSSRPLDFRIYGRGNGPQPGDVAGLTQVRFVDGPDKAAALAESDIVVMPSRYEPFGLMGLEAMASGALLLATTGLGMDEYFRPGHNGLGVEATGRDLADQIRWAAEHWDDTAALRHNGILTAQDWTWDRSVEAHCRVYEALIRQARAA